MIIAYTTQVGVHYTQKSDAVYAICLAWPGKTLRLELPMPTPQTEARLLGHPTSLSWKAGGRGLVIELPQFAPGEIPSRNAWVFKLTGLE